MDDVPAESSGNSDEERPRTKEELDRELDRMAANVRWLRVWGHLRVRPATMATISCDQALELAREVAETMDREVTDVVDFAGLTRKGSRTPCVYNLDLSDCWIAYLATRNPYAIRATDIVAIEKASGAVRYIGSANDEG